MKYDFQPKWDPHNLRFYLGMIGKGTPGPWRSYERNGRVFVEKIFDSENPIYVVWKGKNQKDDANKLLCLPELAKEAHRALGEIDRLKELVSSQEGVIARYQMELNKLKEPNAS